MCWSESGDQDQSAWRTRKAYYVCPLQGRYGIILPQAMNPCLRHGSTLLRLPTARIRGLLGVTPPDPWLHHNSGNSLQSQ